MNNQKPQFYFLLAILAGTSLLAFFIFRPFLYALILAAVFTVVFQPLHQKMLSYSRHRHGVAALGTTLIIIIVILTPLIFLGTQIFHEAQQLYSSLADNGGKEAILNIFNGLVSSFQGFLPASNQFSASPDQYLKQGLGWLLQNLGAIFSNFTKILISSFIFVVALYYLLKDGHTLKKKIIALSPLPDTDDETVLKKLELAINSVIKGSLTIALIQGALTAVGFAVFGVPNAVLWGTVTAVAALIPGIGTALVLIPAIIFLFLSGNTLPALGLLAWGVIAVGLIDNFLGPKLVGRGMQMHPLIVFLSVIGGIIYFGPIGFLLGPLTASLLFVLLDIYSSLVRTK